MQLLWILILLAIGQESEPQFDLEEPSFALLLEVGVRGGFVPPSPHHYVLIQQSDERIEVLELKRNDAGEFEARMGLVGNETFASLKALLKETKFLQLPVEHPRNSMDVYGQDTSIALRVGDRTWKNGAPQTCVRITSSVEPTAEEVVRFKKVANWVKKLAGESVHKTLLPQQALDMIAQARKSLSFASSTSGATPYK